MKTRDQVLAKKLGIAPLGYCTTGGHPFGVLFEESDRVHQSLEGIDALLLLGGEDISPSYYGQQANRHTGAANRPSSRDQWEWGAMKWCIAHNIPMICICRGAQFGTVAAGGKLIQHVNNHNGPDHQIKTHDGKVFRTNSVHHQMMYPFNIPHEMLAWASPSIATTYLGEECKELEDMKDRVEPEIVFYPQIKALCIQGHPEYHNAPTEFKDYCVKLVQELLF